MKKIICIIALTIYAFGFEFNLNSKEGTILETKELKSAFTPIVLSLNNDNAVTGADYDANKKQFVLATKENEFYITDENFKNLRYGKHDRHFIMEMESGVGATWHGDKVGVISFNKTFVFYEPMDNMSKEEQNSQWRHLKEGWDKWKLNDLGDKNRFFTIRAKQQYILGWDYDLNSNKFIVASVPNNVRDYWSIGVFDGDDKMVLEEYIPTLASKLKLKDKRSLGEYYITGIDVQDDIVYLLSKNYSTILKLNLKTKEIESAFAFTGVENARALAVKDNKFYIFSREGKENKVFVFEIE